MRPFQCVPTTYVFSINASKVFTISFFSTNSQLSFIQRNEHVEMNKHVVCHALDCLFYASGSLS